MATRQPDPGKPDLSSAEVIFHHRDPELDQPYGEGVDVTLHALPDGRFYQTQYRYHIDFDGSHDDRFLPRAEVIQTIARHGQSSRAAERFPDSVEARWHRRYGTCYWYGLTDQAARIAADAEVAWRVEGAAGAPPALAAFRHPDELWVFQSPGRDGKLDASLRRPEEALARLLEEGCPLDVLERHFPDAAPVRLVRRLGASSWTDASARHLPALARAAERIHEATGEVAGERWRFALYRLAPGEHLGEQEKSGQATTFTAYDDLGAVEHLLRLRPPEEVWRRLFPDPATLKAHVHELQRRAGISFPAAED